MLKIALRYVRAIKDYYVFYEWKMQKNPILYSSLVALLIIAPIITDWLAPRDWQNLAFLSPIVASILAIVGFTARSLTAYGSKKREFRSNAKLLELTKHVKPSQLEQVAGFETVPPRDGAVGSITYSPSFNADFLSDHAWNPLLIKHEKSNRYKNIIGAIRENAAEFRAHSFRVLLSSLAPNRKTLINEYKVGLMTDLLPETETVEVYRTDYFSDICLVTNGVKDIYELGEHDAKLISDAMDGRMPYVASGGEQVRLREFSTSTPPISLHIGVEVLALSKDFLFRIPLQGKGVQYSQGMRAPYASGSLDWEDCASASTLKEAVLTGAKRELEEEWGGKGKIPRIQSMEVMGYFRHGERGGKPQFVCIAKLDEDDADIWPDTSENNRGDTPVRTSSIEALSKEVERLLSQQFNNPDSVALFGALTCLKGILRDRPDFVSRVFFPNLGNLTLQPESI